MGRASVRTAIKAYFPNGTPTTLNTVHRAKPRNWDAGDFRFDSTTRSSASAYVHIERVQELRAATGAKFLSYTCALVVLLRSQEVDAELTMDAWDALLDGIKARLRVKPALGGSDATLFTAAELLLEDEADLPQDEAAMNEIWGVVRFDVGEWIIA